VSAEQLFTGIAQLVTAQGAGPKRGRAQGELTVVEDAALAIAGGKIMWIGRREDWRGTANATVDLGGRAVLPGLVDPHTHAVWAGERFADFEARARGESYEAILARGGGIRSTMRHTAAASPEELVALALPRLEALMRSGATTVEVKSGYGFTLEAELKMLEAVRALQTRVPARLVPTLLVHVPPQHEHEREAYLDMAVSELIPEAARQALAVAVDVFVEKEAFSALEAERILAAARGHGLAVKLHADQFHALGGVELGIRHGALSVDHLEASGEEQIKALAQSDTVATLLPGVSLHLGLAGAPGRRLVDAGAAVAVATDLNPGSSPLYSQALAMALSIRLNGLTPAEALVAATANAAAALGLADAGRLEIGCRADFLVLDGPDWRELTYALGKEVVAEVWVGGRRQALQALWADRGGNRPHQVAGNRARRHPL
jgi:imidazolonepropionase